MSDCNCDPPPDRITAAMSDEARYRITLWVGAQVGSIPESVLKQAHQEVTNITGLPTDESYADRKCQHGRDFTEVVVHPVGPQ